MQMAREWALNAAYLDDAVAGLSRMEEAGKLHAAVIGSDAAGAIRSENVDGVEVVPVVGVLVKYTAPGLRDYGFTSSALLARAIESAARNDRVKSVVLHIESPGGEVRGIGRVLEAIASTRRVKQVHAVVDDLAASGAAMIAGACGKVWANVDAKVGNLGVYTHVVDVSKMLDRIGVKVHVVKFGAYKATGLPGTEITPEQLAEAQRVIDGIAQLAIDRYAAGRGMTATKARALFDGRIHLATDAMKLGLIDGVKGVGQVVAELVKSSGGGRSEQSQNNYDEDDVMKSDAQCKEEAGRFEDLVSDKVAAGVPRNKAVIQVATKYPHLHAGYLAHTNPRNQSLRMR